MKQQSIGHQLLLTAGLIASQSAFAGTDVWFTPLTESAMVVAPNGYEELASPWITPEGIHQKNIISLREIEDQVPSPGQSTIRVGVPPLTPDRASYATMFDMLAYDPTGSYLFIPHEILFGAGCTRVSLYDNHAEVIFAGDQKGAQGDWSNDFGAFDPARWTPNNTLFLGEEYSGLGRIVEILNPLTDANGVPLPGITDPFRDGPTNDPRTNTNTRGGRPAADDAGATPYGRPEDMSVGKLANGNEVLFIAV